MIELLVGALFVVGLWFGMLKLIGLRMSGCGNGPIYKNRHTQNLTARVSQAVLDGFSDE